MDKKIKGFTLIELVIAVAISGLLVSFLSQVIAMSVKAYGINLENSDAMTRITPVVKRIETEITESSEAVLSTASAIIGTIPSAAGTVTFTSITVRTVDTAGSEVNHQFFWDGDGDGSPGTGDAAAHSDNDISKSIYRVSGSAIDVLLAAKGNVPASLMSKYGSDWNFSYVKVKTFYFEFYKEGTASGSTVRWQAGDLLEKIRYIKIHIELEGSVQKSAFNFDTGFKIK